MAIAARFNLKLKQYNVVNAFINAQLEDIIYMRIPSGHKNPKKILQLQKALYGLRQLLLLWQKELTSTLLALKFQTISHKPYILIKSGILIFFYVNDIVLAYRKKNTVTA